MILHIFMYNVISDFSAATPASKGRVKVIDESPFFVRPFPISESDKPFMDKQMERLVSLGILSKNSTSHTSPVMLITRKLTCYRFQVNKY